jgi:hypothetical protein
MIYRDIEMKNKKILCEIINQYGYSLFKEEVENFINNLNPGQFIDIKISECTRPESENWTFEWYGTAAITYFEKDCVY